MGRLWGPARRWFPCGCRRGGIGKFLDEQVRLSVEYVAHRRSLRSCEAAKQLAPNAGLALSYPLCPERLALAALTDLVEKTTDASIRVFPGRLKALSPRLHADPLTLERYIRGPATNCVLGAYTTLARGGGQSTKSSPCARGETRCWKSWAGDCKPPLRDAGVGSKSDLRRAVSRDLDRRRFGPGNELRAALFQATVRLDEIGAKARSVLESALMDPTNGCRRGVSGCCVQGRSTIARRRADRRRRSPRDPQPRRHRAQDRRRLAVRRPFGPGCPGGRGGTPYHHL
jgi:hypothetical protein